LGVKEKGEEKSYPKGQREPVEREKLGGGGEGQKATLPPVERKKNFQVSVFLKGEAGWKKKKSPVKH